MCLSVILEYKKLYSRLYQVVTKVLEIKALAGVKLPIAHRVMSVIIVI